MSNSSDRIAVVVGAASGIGWATARALADDGCRVTLADRNGDGARARAADLGDPHTAADVDVTDEASVSRLFEQVGPIDVVVNCAGFGSLGLITDLAVDEFRSVVDVCLTGSFIVAKYAGQKLREGGSLVTISSLNGRQPAIGMSAYCAAKAGVSMLTQVAALELGRKGIRVNAVSPGFVETPLTEGSSLIPGLVEDYAENSALGRVGQPEEVADAVVFLCSPKSAWLTGEVLDLNGGAHLKRYPDVLGHVMKLAEAQ